MASKRYAEIDTATIDNLKNDILTDKLPQEKCPESKPLFNGQHCIYCPEGTYYNLKDLNCYTPKMVSNTVALGNLDNFVEFGKHTLGKLIEDDKASIMPT